MTIEPPDEIPTLTAQVSNSQIPSAPAVFSRAQKKTAHTFFLTIPCIPFPIMEIHYRSLRYITKVLWYTSIVWAFASLYGLIMMVMGNAILRAAGREEFVSDIVAVHVGAVGGLFANMPLFIASAIWNFWDGAIALIGGPLSGVIGVAFLRHFQVDIGGFGSSHAALAGLVGGSILAIPASIFFFDVLNFTSFTIGNGPGKIWDAIRSKLFHTGTVDAHGMA